MPTSPLHPTNRVENYNRVLNSHPDDPHLAALRRQVSKNHGADACGVPGCEGLVAAADFPRRTCSLHDDPSIRKIRYPAAWR